MYILNRQDEAFQSVARTVRQNRCRLDAYQRFDWKVGYIPNDLEARGFPVKDLDMKRYQNYVYGRNMIALWNKLGAFVASALAKAYPTDADVFNDKALEAFSNEMRDPLGGAIGKFPVIKTIDDLVDMVTMAIHIASPQQTATNYLQHYYQEFVPNKPTCLCAPLPSTLAELENYTEAGLVAALPVKHPRGWFMMPNIMYLLSSDLEEEQTLMNYALSLQRVADTDAARDDPISAAAGQLVTYLMELKDLFLKHNEEMDDQTLPYLVLDPARTAISILI